MAGSPKLKLLARVLRNHSTRAEIVLWQHLKGKQMMGYDFHRQKQRYNFRSVYTLIPDYSIRYGTHCIKS